jgi:alpha-aminoadipate carrier protein LysW
MPTAKCSDCEAALTLDEGTIKGEILACAECGVELEVVAVEPLKLQPAPREEEDWGE